MLFLFLLALSYKPIMILNFIPIVIGVTNKLTTDNTIANPHYQISEYFLSNMAFFHTLIILVPNQWKTNSIVFSVTMAFFGHKIWDTYHVWNDHLTPAITTT